MAGESRARNKGEEGRNGSYRWEDARRGMMGRGSKCWEIFNARKINKINSADQEPKWNRCEMPITCLSGVGAHCAPYPWYHSSSWVYLCSQLAIHNKYRLHRQHTVQHSLMEHLPPPCCSQALLPSQRNPPFLRGQDNYRNHPLREGESLAIDLVEASDSPRFGTSNYRTPGINPSP